MGHCFVGRSACKVARKLAICQAPQACDAPLHAAQGNERQILKGVDGYIEPNHMLVRSCIGCRPCWWAEACSSVGVLLQPWKVGWAWGRMLTLHLAVKLHSINVHPWQAIMGPSGCGKTTLLGEELDAGDL